MRFTFRHEAMVTYFEIIVADAEERYARQAAAAAFRELEKLELELSRFLETSDISRANRLARGESTVLGDSAFECLLIAADVALATNRTFDPSYASERPPDLPADTLPFVIDPESHRLTSLATRLRLDLGAVGKGFALDRMADVLREWEISAACLNSGGSTALAVAAPQGEPGWPVGVGDEGQVRVLSLQNQALSGSGLAVKGEHLIDPRNQSAAARKTRAWSLAPNGAQADALSTAFFIMDDAEVARFCAEHPTIGAALAGADGTLAFYGALGER